MSDATRQLQMVNYIKENRQWARVSDNAWCVRGEDNTTTAEIRDNLNARLPGILQGQNGLYLPDVNTTRAQQDQQSGAHQAQEHLSEEDKLAKKINEDNAAGGPNSGMFGGNVGNALLQFLDALNKTLRELTYTLQDAERNRNKAT